MRRITYKELLLMLKGSTILCAGGGGTMEDAIEMIRGISSFNMISLGDVNENDMVFTIFSVGTLESQEKFDYNAIEKYIMKLEDMLNVKFSAVMPVEIGPVPISQAALVASEMKIPLLDADMVGGRSSPEIFLETITLAGIDRTPLIAINRDNEEVVLDKKTSPNEIETILREFASRSGGCAYVIGYPMRISEIKDFVGDGTISLSLDIGRLMDSETEAGVFSEKLSAITGCKQLFKGKVKRVEVNNSGGFSSGKIIIQNYEDEFRILFKNENIACWLEEELILTVPDIICVFSPDGFRGLCNCEIREGANVLVFGIPSIDIWKTEKGLSIFNPRVMGFDIDTKILKERLPKEIKIAP